MGDPPKNHVAHLDIKWVVGHVEVALELDIVMTGIHQWVFCAGEYVLFVRAFLFDGTQRIIALEIGSKR